ncbi:MAG TPA: hypothetical protein VGL93_21775 [Streptosporangiaceae bacterium]|jgi:hypothetical protein
MSHDVVALVRGAPDVQATVSQMIAAGERVHLVPAESNVHLCDDDGRPLVSVEAPQFIQVSGEVERLVGPETAEQAGTPVWWVEARAASAVVGAADVARRFAEQVVQDCGGVLWAPTVSEPVRHAVPGEEPVPGETGERPAMADTGDGEPDPGPAAEEAADPEPQADGAADEEEGRQ